MKRITHDYVLIVAYEVGNDFVRPITVVDQEIIDVDGSVTHHRRDRDSVIIPAVAPAWLVIEFDSDDDSARPVTIIHELPRGV